MTVVNRSNIEMVSRRDLLLAGGAMATLTAMNGAIVGMEGARKVVRRDASHHGAGSFSPIVPPAWVREVSRMTFCVPDQVPAALEAGAQVVHTNVVWPYFPLSKDGGGLNEKDAAALRKCVRDCHDRKLKLILGLPPFPSVAHVQAHPDWRIDAVGDGAAHRVEPREDNLGTRVGCNHGPWGNYLIDLCVELVNDYQVDGFSFDGNYHAPLCLCAACQADYTNEQEAEIPAKIDLNDVAYRRYLVWRGEKLEQHYRRLQKRLKAQNADAVVMTWTTNAGRYGHLLHSPRVMSTRMNQLIDLPMQEWWLDDTNFGGSVAPAFGAAYLRALAGDRPCASEPYLMSRGNPYSPDSFPLHERRLRALLALTHGNVTAQSLGWPGGVKGAAAVFADVQAREPECLNNRPLKWAAMLVSEQTRQFYAFAAIAERFLPHVFGAFRMALEEHMPLDLVNDWDLTAERLREYKVLLLPNTAALSNPQVQAVREFVAAGGGLVASGETSLCDELGRPRGDFALADVLGVSYAGRPQAPLVREELDANFAVSLDESYWAQRVGAARLQWKDHQFFHDERLKEYCPTDSSSFRGPLVVVSEPAADEAVARYTPEGSTAPPLPAVVARNFGQGRVVYLAACLDAALWSYAYPYQRLLLRRAVEWAAVRPCQVRVHAPLCVQATYFDRPADSPRQVLIHLFNNLNTSGGHGKPDVDVPLREESIPIAGIRVELERARGLRCRLFPGGETLQLHRGESSAYVELPPLEMHALVLVEIEE